MRVPGSVLTAIGRGVAEQPLAAVAGFFWGFAGCLGGLVFLALLLLGAVAALVS